MSTNEGFIVLNTITLVLFGALLYLVPKYNRWVDRHEQRKKEEALSHDKR